MTGQNTFQVFSISLVLTLAGIEAARAEESPRPALELRKGGNTIPEYGLRRTKAPPEKAQSKVEIERIPRNSFSTEVVRRETWTNAVGEVVVEESSYFHLFPGANLKDAATGEWKSAQVNIREESNGVVAEGWFTARFGDSLADESFAVLAATGQRLSGHITGLRYEDLATGKTVMLATTKRSLPAKDADGRIVYADAFEGLVKGEIVYIVKSGQVEQDIVILNRLPDPASLGLDPAGTFVQAVTRFAEAPAPTVQQRQISVSAGAGEIPFQDHHLWFGPVHMAMGRAFAKAAEAAPSARTPVYKRWESSPEGATLIESVPYSAYQQLEEAAGLPQQLDPAEGKSLAGSPAVVLDWIAVQSQPTYTFETGQTYRITGYISISTSATFEPWCILKYDRNAQLQLQGAVTFPTSGQAILTAVDDHTIGEQVGTDPAPTGTYAQIALYIYPSQLSGTIKNTQIRYAYEGIQAYCAYLYLEDISYINCTRALAAYATTVYETDGIRCDTPTEFHNYGSAYWVPSGNYVHVVGTNDRDSDLLSNFEELVWWFSDPRNAYTWSGIHTDGEYDLTAISGETGTRVSLSILSATYNQTTDLTDLTLGVVGAGPSEFHEMYLYDSGTYWRNLFATYDHSAFGQDIYTAQARGDQTEATFAALSFSDIDNDALRDGYEVKMTKTIVGNADSLSSFPGAPPTSNNGIADGDEDLDSDTITNASESKTFGTNPTVAEDGADNDGDGLPNWVETYIVYWMGATDPGSWDDPDNDGLPNAIEIRSGTDPVLQDQDVFIPPSGESAQFVDLEISASYTDSSGPASNLHFPGAGAAAGNIGLMTGMYVELPDPPSGPGTHTADLYLKIAPAFDSLVPIPQPDPLDGNLWMDIIVKSTDLANDVWAEIDDDVLNLLRKQTLEYLRVDSLMVISVKSRRIQWLLTLPESTGRLLRLKRAISVIHTEMTKLTAITVRYGNLYPDDWVVDFLGAAGRLATAIAWYKNFTDFWQKLKVYRNEVAQHVDCTGPAFLSLSIQEILQDTPGLAPAAKNALGFFNTTPLFDPNPLGWYDHGGCN